MLQILCFQTVKARFSSLSYGLLTRKLPESAAAKLRSDHHTWKRMKPAATTSFDLLCFGYPAIESRDTQPGEDHRFIFLFSPLRIPDTRIVPCTHISLAWPALVYFVFPACVSFKNTLASNNCSTDKWFWTNFYEPNICDVSNSTKLILLVRFSIWK